MSEGRRERTDEELEALLRRQPRRPPSAALWERVAADALAAPPRRPRRLVWAGVVVAAAAGVFALWLTPRPAPRPVSVAKANPPRAQVQAAAPRDVATRPLAQPSPVVHRSHAPRLVLAKHSERPVVVAPKDTEPARGPEVGPPPKVLPAVATEETNEFSYYLEVSHDGERSVLSGSVTRNSLQQVTQISMNYDAGDRTDAKIAN